MIGGSRLSDHFARQAWSDLRDSQRVARAAASGHSVGTSLHLCHQSYEKGLKSTVLLLAEMYAPSASAGLAPRLGHSVYPGLYRLYANGAAHDAGGGAAPATGQIPGTEGAHGGEHAHDRDVLRLLNAFWRGYSGHAAWQTVMWRRSMGVGLGRDEESALENLHLPHAALLLEAVGMGAEAGHFGLARVPPSLDRGDILDAGRLGRRRAEHARLHGGSGLHGVLERALSLCRSRIEPARRGGAGPGPRAARRALLEYGTRVLVCHLSEYMAIFPHGTMGRYPQALDPGTTTVCLYESQRGHALHYPFVGVPHALRQLSAHSGRIAALWGAAREAA